MSGEWTMFERRLAKNANQKGRDVNELFAAFCEWVKADEAKRGGGHLALWSDGCGRVEGVFMVDICFDNPEDGIRQFREALRGSVPGGSPTQERE